MELICTLLWLYSLAILARIFMSWVRIEPGTGLGSAYSFLFNITEPVLGPVRSVIPPVRMGVAALDLSPILVFVVIQLIC